MTRLSAAQRRVLERMADDENERIVFRVPGGRYRFRSDTQSIAPATVFTLVEKECLVRTSRPFADVGVFQLTDIGRAALERAGGEE